jgi:hypothetical protein
MNFISKKEIKYVKLILISPWLGQLIDIFYLISLPLIVFKFIMEAMDNYQVHENSTKFFEIEKFRTIENKEDLFNYYINITNMLYDYSSFPVFIPIGALRIKKFSHKNECYEIEPECKTSFSCNLIYLLF